jgi:hypothetical protein
MSDNTRPDQDQQDADVLASISFAGSMFAGAIASISHNEIGDAASWDCWGTPEQEIARLTRALDRMQTAIGAARAELRILARRRAAAESRDEG